MYLEQIKIFLSFSRLKNEKVKKIIFSYNPNLNVKIGKPL